MIKLFHDKVILTTQNPEAFLTFNVSTGDPDYWICPSSNVGGLYVNGIDINTYISHLIYALTLNNDTSIASYHIYTRELNDFDINFKFLFYDSVDCSIVTNTIDVSIHNRPNIAALNIYDNDNILVDGESSYLILRSNPKFTGNIKLVIDTSDNIFLDTFQISDILKNKKYRKQQISSNSVLSNDISNVFKSLPLGELYSNDTLNIAVPRTEYINQYNTIYNYGTRLLKDDLYSQDNGILAPLWINSTIPDYFCIFRLPGVYNEETYDGSALANLASKYLEESELIKTWNLKSDSPLGTYLNTHLLDLNKVPAPVFLSLTNPSIATAESDPNTWYGIAIDKGVLTGRSETPYFFNKKINNFTELNAFVSGGFERNNLVCPNLLNIEFIFDDNDVSAYTMNRYFGLYLTENVLYHVGYYSPTEDSSTTILSLDGRNISTFIDSSIFDSDGSINSIYKNRIFVINDGTILTRISNSNQLTLSNLVSTPKENIFSTEVTKNLCNPFITLTINNLLNQGEHLRLINRTTNEIWEAFSIDSSSSCERYISKHVNAGYPTLYQTAFQVGDTISEQIRNIEIAFDTFSQYTNCIFRSGVRGDNWVSLILNDDASFNDDWIFQRITSQTLNDFTDPSSGFNNAANENDITFFGRFTPSPSDFSQITYDASFGPINFELYGDRKSIFVDLFNRQINILYSFSSDVVDKFVENMLYQDASRWYKKLQNFVINTNLTSYSYQYVLDPLSIDTQYLIQSEENIQTINNTVNIYSIKDVNISLMGINSIKDIDYTVYDASNLNVKSEYWYKRDGDVSTYKVTIEAGDVQWFDIRNSYQIESGTGVILPPDKPTYAYTPNTVFNTFFGNTRVDAITKTIVSYSILDGNKTYNSYTTGTTEENVYDYYDSSTLLKYSLTSPTVSKWSGLGTDCRNNEFRLMLNVVNLLDGTNSNFIPFSTNFNDEISYPVFKYLTPGIRNWEDYIFNDINDTVVDASSYSTIKELMFSHPYTDIFSKLIYYNNDTDAIKNRSSIVHYNEYNKSVNVLFLGLNLSFKIRDGINLNAKDYDKYRFSFISTSSKNRNNRRPIELIINENTKTILMVWYQGSDILNYTFRNSTYVPGKSLFDVSNYGFVNDLDISSSTNYSFIKTPFIVNNSTVVKFLVDTYLGGATNSSFIRPYAQFNYGTYNVSSIWNAYTNANSILNGKIYSGPSYTTFNQLVNYTYYSNINTYGNGIANYGYKYNTNENIYNSYACALDQLNYFIDSTRDFIAVYIIRDTTTLSNDDFSFTPIKISINLPRLFNGTYTYNGWFTPKLDNILEFKSNEEQDLINIVQKDFILSNTNLKLYKNIDQLWYNKVTSSVSTTDVSVGNAIAYKDFNVFNALWDADYYFKSDTSTYINGYQCTGEIPAFFGSKLPKFPDYLEISSWSSSTVSITYNTTNTIMSFNLTKVISELFKNNITFINNWSGLSGTGSTIEAYINNEILSYYNISISKIKVDFYYRPYNTTTLWSTFDSNFIIDNKINYKTELAYEKNEYIYKLTVSTENNYSYFVKFTMFEK